MLDHLCHVGQDSHTASAFLASNLMGKIAIDPTRTSTASSDANYVTSSDIYDERYLCDTPLMGGAGNCSCAVGSRGLVGDSGRVFPGSSLGGQNAVIGPVGIQGPVAGVPHPSFRFAQKIDTLSVDVKDITIPGSESKTVWNANFLLNNTDTPGGSDYLPSSAQPIGGDMQSFHKLCSALNSYRTYKLHLVGGGQAGFDQTIVLTAKIVQPPEMIDPTVAGGIDGETSNLSAGDSLKAVGPRLIEIGGNPPQSDQVPALNGARTSSFAQTNFPTISNNDGTILIQPESRTFPAVTSTTFADKPSAVTSTTFADCCGECAPKKNLPGCHQPPTVTIHIPNRLGLSNFI